MTEENDLGHLFAGLADAMGYNARVEMERIQANRPVHHLLRPQDIEAIADAVREGKEPDTYYLVAPYFEDDRLHIRRLYETAEHTLYREIFSKLELGKNYTVRIDREVRPGEWPEHYELRYHLKLGLVRMVPVYAYSDNTAQGPYPAPVASSAPYHSWRTAVRYAWGDIKRKVRWGRMRWRRRLDGCGRIIKRWLYRIYLYLLEVTYDTDDVLIRFLVIFLLLVLALAFIGAVR